MALGGVESTVSGSVEAERAPAEGGERFKESRVRDELSPVSCSGCRSCCFEELASYTYKFPALQQKVVNVFDLLAQVAIRGVNRFETVQVTVKRAVPGSNLSYKRSIRS